MILASALDKRRFTNSDMRSKPKVLVGHVRENCRFVLQIYDQLGKLLPRVQVEPPGPNSKKIANVLGEYETPTLSPVRMGEIPTSWKQARGANVIDVDDNVYVDLT